MCYGRTSLRARGRGVSRDSKPTFLFMSSPSKTPPLKFLVNSSLLMLSPSGEVKSPTMSFPRPIPVLRWISTAGAPTCTFTNGFAGSSVGVRTPTINLELYRGVSSHCVKCVLYGVSCFQFLLVCYVYDVCCVTGWGTSTGNGDQGHIPGGG